jgi:hypothetical protein
MDLVVLVGEVDNVDKGFDLQISPICRVSSLEDALILGHAH